VGIVYLGPTLHALITSRQIAAAPLMPLAVLRFSVELGGFAVIDDSY